MKLQPVIVAIALLALASCKKENNWSKIPNIELKNIAPNVVQSGVPSGVWVTFSITDGDGDLGRELGDPEIFFVSNRDSIDAGLNYNYNFPSIPKEALDNGGIQGTVDVVINGTGGLLMRPDHTEVDTVVFTMHVIDRAGNESNKITLPEIYIVP